MVLAQAVCAANLASAVMANGLCCLYKMREHDDDEFLKEEHKRMFRGELPSEMERRRYKDMIRRQHEKDQLDAGESGLHHNRKLIATVDDCPPTLSAHSSRNELPSRSSRERPHHKSNITQMRRLESDQKIAVCKNIASQSCFKEEAIAAELVPPSSSSWTASRSASSLIDCEDEEIHLE